MQNFVTLNPQSIAPKGLSVDCRSRVIKHADYAHYLDAQAIIHHAKQQAQEIIAGAEAEKQGVFDHAYAQGLEAAKQAQSETLLTTVGLCQEYLQASHKEIADIALGVARKLLGDMDCDTLVMTLIEQALANKQNGGQVTLRVARSQLALVNENVGRLMREFPGLGQLDVCEDERVEAGSCLLETPIGLINASLASQLDAIENSVRQLASAT